VLAREANARYPLSGVRAGLFESCDGREGHASFYSDRCNICDLFSGAAAPRGGPGRRRRSSGSHVCRMKLTIDLERPSVTLTGEGVVLWRPRTSQWVEFYVALGLARLGDVQDAWITAKALRELSGWRAKKFASVGKIVARHLGQMRARYGTWIVEAPQVTAQWRITLRPSDIAVVPSSADGTDWLRRRGAGLEFQPLSCAWLTSVTKALMCLHLGRSAEAKDKAMQALHVRGIDDRSARIAAFVSARAAASKGDLSLDREQIETVLRQRTRRTHRTERDLWGDDSVGRHIRMRLAALTAIESDAASAAEQRPRLGRRIGPLSNSGDLIGLAILHNVLGLLAAREKNYPEADYHLAEAIRLALTVSDFFTLGGALFNLAHLLVLQADIKDDRETGDFALALLMLCIEMDQKMRVGRNSAQAEILGARLLIARGELERAEALLQGAQEVVSDNDSAYDAGCLLTARAMLTCAKIVLGHLSPELGRSTAGKLLSEASEKFAISGRNIVADVDTMLERTRAAVNRSCRKRQGA
jgi:tetratricopeptide (TPR) repeat protein